MTYKDKTLLLEDKIALINKLSSFYKLSDLFFSLRDDVIISANEQYAVPEKRTQDDADRIAADKIREICERLSLLDDCEDDCDHIAKRKRNLKLKLSRLTKDIEKN